MTTSESISRGQTAQPFATTLTYRRLCKLTAVFAHTPPHTHTHTGEWKEDRIRNQDTFTHLRCTVLAPSCNHAVPCSRHAHAVQVIPTEEGLCTIAFEPHAGLSSIASHMGDATGAPLTSTAMSVQVTLPFGGSWPHLGEMEKRVEGGG